MGDRIPNNEVLDFLSRVPSDIELVGGGVGSGGVGKIG